MHIARDIIIRKGGWDMVITLGREFGSGGRELGRRLADHLQIAYYDKEILSEIAKRTQLTEEYDYRAQPVP